MSDWKIYHDRGGATSATVVEHIPTSSFGVAVCAPQDNFSRKRGAEIAKLRALEVLRRDGQMLIGIPSKGSGYTFWRTKIALRRAYPHWQHVPEAVAMLTPELWMEIPYSEIPKILGPEEIMNREFKGYDWFELCELWGIHGSEEDGLAAVREKIQDEMVLAADGKSTYVTRDLRNFVAKLALQQEQTDAVLWTGLYLVKCDWTFLKYCSILLESMWS